MVADCFKLMDMPWGSTCVSTRRPGSGWMASETMTKSPNNVSCPHRSWKCQRCTAREDLRPCAMDTSILQIHRVRRSFAERVNHWVLVWTEFPHLLEVAHLTWGCLVRLNCLLSLALFRGLCSQLCVSVVEMHLWAWTRSLYPNTLAEEGLNFATQVHLCLEEILQTVQHN